MQNLSWFKRYEFLENKNKKIIFCIWDRKDGCLCNLITYEQLDISWWDQRHIKYLLLKFLNLLWFWKIWINKPNICVPLWISIRLTVSLWSMKSLSKYIQTNLHISSTNAVYFSKYNGSDIYYQSFKLISWSPTPPKKKLWKSKNRQN